ncbi:MAG: hypothetical protein ACN6OB_22235 [Chryseobacterium jejuense]
MSDSTGYLKEAKGSDNVADEAMWLCVRLERINEIDSIFAPLKYYNTL